MKPLIIALISLAILGCGKVKMTTPGGTTLTFNSNPIAEALADVSECAPDQVIVHSMTGHSAFCIDQVRHGSSVTHYAATAACAISGRHVCDPGELQSACTNNIAVDSSSYNGSPLYYWTSQVAFQGSAITPVAFFGCSGAGSISQGLWSVTQADYYCCSR